MSTHYQDNKRTQLAKRQAQGRRRIAFAPIACLVVLITALTLSSPAISMTRGTLECGLEEHEHASECYEQVLVCQADEAEGHAHENSCYEAKLACGKEAHEHTSACYSTSHAAVTTQAVEGKFNEDGSSASDEQSQEQGDGSGQDQDQAESGTSSSATDAEGSDEATEGSDEASDGLDDDSASEDETLDDDQDGTMEDASDEDADDDSDEQSTSGDPDASDEAASSKESASTIVTSDNSSSKVFKTKFKDANGTKVEVRVEAPEDAFPEGTTMQAALVDDDDVIDAAKEQAAAESDMDEDTLQALAVDISFQDADGEEVEPQREVKVAITSKAVSEQSELAVVHVDDDLNAEVVPEGDVTVDQAKDRVAFEASAFSVYAIVYTVDFAYNVDGQTYAFTLQGGGDSVSLRELAEELHVVKDDPATAENEIDSFVNGIESAEFSDPELLYVGKAKKDTTSGDIIWDNKLDVAYPLGLSQQEVLEINAKKYAKDEWVLIALQPFDTEETLTITMDDGEEFTIEVTDAQDAIMVGDQVQTIANPAGTTVDLFDYWVVSQELVGREGWDNLNQSWGSHPDTEGDDGYNLNGGGNNMGINASANDEAHGHALKFSPAWDGTVYNGTKVGTHRYYPNWDSGDHDAHNDVEEPWRSLNRQGEVGLNNYTGNGNPFQGIVQGALDGGYPVLTANNTIGSNGESLKYLFDPSVDHGGKASYPSVNQLLYVDIDGYYTYDSRDYAAALNNDGKTFTVTEQTSSNTEIRGFWPFGTQNFWTGLHINTQFSMPANGQVLNPKGELKDMQFEFSGDDDTWLYVDGVLVGDGGGIHNRTEIDVNFAAGTVTVTGKKDPAHTGDFEQTLWLDELFNAAGKGPQQNPDDWEPIPDSTHYRFKPGTYHSFDMFYLERGGGESNLYIHYNLVSTADFTAHKAYTGIDEDDRLQRNAFKFELIGLNGKYWSVYNEQTGSYELVQKDTTSKAIMPNNASISGEGTVESPYFNDDTSTKLSNGETVGSQTYITSATEDGNVNFGSAVISPDDMNEADQGKPPVYRYIVREIVPDDAVNSAGKTWASATDEEKAAGGFVKDNITYDGTVYYMAARVTSWTETNASGQQVVRHGLSKTYYTDDTYTTVKQGATFIDFRNVHSPDFGDVDFTKVDGSSSPLGGATFALYKDQACTVPAKWVDQPGSPEIVATSNAEGKVEFRDVRTGTYYMKETATPQGYALDGTVYKVVIEDRDDTSKHSKITILGDQTNSQVSQIVNTEPGKLTVQKKWLNSSSAEVSGGANSVTVWLKRKRQVQDETTGSHTVAVKMTCEDGGVHEGETKTFTVDGDTVVIEWDDEWQRNFNWWLTVGSNQYEGWIGDEHVVNENYEFHQVSNDGRSRQLIIKNAVGDISLTTKYWVTWLHSDSNHWNNLNSPVVTGSGAEYVFETDEAFNNEHHTQTLGNGKQWSHSWRIGGNESNHSGCDFPATDDGGRQYLYYVSELGADGNEIEIGADATGDYYLEGYSPNNNIGVSDQGVITVYNKEKQGPTVNLNIVKIAEHEAGTDRTYLDGAKFHLEKKNVVNNVYEVYGDQFTVSGQDGVTIQNLTDGSYKLVEDEAPEGYVIESEGYEFTVADGAVVEGSSEAMVEYTAAGNANPAQFAVVNKPGAPLPNTGGPGIAMLTALGCILAVGGAGIMIRNRRGSR